MKIIENEIPTHIKQGNDNKVISELYKVVFPKVKKYIVRHNGVEDDAYDVFQDAVLYFYKQVIENKFNEVYTVYGYIFRLSINRWLNKLKRDKRVDLMEHIESQDHLLIDESDFSDIRLIRNNGNLLEKLFANIGEKCIELLTYTIYYNLMAEDIALRMGFRSEGAVKMQLKRCREKLYEETEKNPVVLSKIKGE